MTIIQIGCAGFYEAYCLATDNKRELLNRFPQRLIDKICADWQEYESKTKAVIETMGSLGFSAYSGENDDSGKNIWGLEDGLFAGLWNMGETLKTGLSVDLRLIPISQEIVEISEYFDINPFKSKSKESFILIEEGDGRELIQMLRSKHPDVPVSIIGSLRSDNDRVYHYDENVGYLTPGE